ILIGLLLAQGLYYGLWSLFNGVHLAFAGREAHDVWTTLYGLLLLQCLQALALVAGGALAGAGQRRGAAYGGVVGVWNGLIFVWLQHRNLDWFTPVMLYGQPVLQTAFGAAGGFLGTMIWRPLPSVLGPAAAADSGPTLAAHKPLRLLRGPVAWGRVIMGVGVALGGAIWAEPILDWVLACGEGKLSVDTYLQAHLITWEITGLAMLVGSALAGATTFNGVKQGLCVGIGTATVLLGLRLGAKTVQADALVLTLLTALTLGLVGGWFGCQLFPPLAKYVRRRGVGAEPA
ncbi:MAG TPA: hypothetical protein VJ739_15110, partial [Gemmataceae bacterium]|nr:hypothetical protein [Gemmataceae bacterium]